MIAVGVAAIPTGILGSGFSELVGERRKKQGLDEQDGIVVTLEVPDRCQECTVCMQ